MNKLTRNTKKSIETGEEKKQMENFFNAETYIRDSEPESDWEYVPEGQLELPKEFEDFFEEQGKATRWVRYVISGIINTSNIEKNKKKGYEFVRIQDLPEHFQERFGNALVDSMKDYVTSSDMVLMAVPLYKKAIVKKFLDSKANNQQNIVRDMLRQGKDEKYVQNVNESTSKVTGGGTREVNFADRQKANNNN